MPFPIIPVLAFAGIIGGVSTLVWYSNQSVEKQQKADQLAIKWFGKKFKQLAKSEQNQIRNRIG